MRINKQMKKSSYCNLSEIKYGEAFSTTDDHVKRYYIKTKCVIAKLKDSILLTGVDLSSGLLRVFDSDIKVEKVNGYFTMEEQK